MNSSPVICTFCGETLNEGARFCRSCGRKQPASPQVIRHRLGVLFIALIIVAVPASVAAVIWQIQQRDHAILQSRATAAFCGQSADAAEKFVTRLHDEGNSWKQSEAAFRSFLQVSCPILGQ